MNTFQKKINAQEKLIKSPSNRLNIFKEIVNSKKVKVDENVKEITIKEEETDGEIMG